MEADLSRTHHLRYSDRWRFDAHGNRLLTLREIWVRIEDLPGDSRIVKHFNGGRPRWGDETYLIADLIHVWSGKPHPARPKAASMNAPTQRETARNVRAQRDRLRAKRKREIEAARREVT